MVYRKGVLLFLDTFRFAVADGTRLVLRMVAAALFVIPMDFYGYFRCFPVPFCSARHFGIICPLLLLPVVYYGLLAAVGNHIQEFYPVSNGALEQKKRTQNGDTARGAVTYVLFSFSDRDAVETRDEAVSRRSTGRKETYPDRRCYALCRYFFVRAVFKRTPCREKEGKKAAMPITDILATFRRLSRIDVAHVRSLVRFGTVTNRSERMELSGLEKKVPPEEKRSNKRCGDSEIRSSVP